jgi:hypothetical protein
MLRALSFVLLVCTAVACERGVPDAQGPAPTPEERLADWATLPEGTSVPVSISFGRTLPDSAVAALLDRHELRPYAIYMAAAGEAGTQRRERSRASLELLAEAREQTIAQLRTSLCAQQGRARSMLAPGPTRPRSTAKCSPASCSFSARFPSSSWGRR